MNIEITQSNIDEVRALLPELTTWLGEKTTDVSTVAIILQAILSCADSLEFRLKELQTQQEQNQEENNGDEQGV